MERTVRTTGSLVVLVILITMVTVATVAACGSSKSDGATSSPSAAATSASASPTAAGALTWKVVSADQVDALVLPTGDKRASQGTWVVVVLEVTNGSSTDMTVKPADVTIAGSDGQTYTVSPDTLVAVDSPLVVGTAPAGKTFTRIAAFDLPTQAVRGATLVVSGDSAGGAGEIRLPLGK